MVIADIIRDNDTNTLVKVQGKNPIDDCDPWAETYYHGRLGDIPDILRNCRVLRTGWLIGSQCHCIEIPYIKK